MKYRIMFLGGPHTGNIDKNEWGHKNLVGGPVVFPVREWVIVDPEGETRTQRKEFLQHLVKKARHHRDFKFEEFIEGEKRGPGRPKKEQVDGDTHPA